MKSKYVKPQLILYFCILTGLLVLILPWGFAVTDMTFSHQSLVFPSINTDKVHLGIWELNGIRLTSFSSPTELSIASEATRQKLDLLTAFARSGLVAAPIIAIVLLSTSWRYLSRGSRFRVLFLFLISAVVLFIYLLLLGPNLTGTYIKKTVVKAVQYNWLILLMMSSNLVLGLGSSIYYILSR